MRKAIERIRQIELRKARIWTHYNRNMAYMDAVIEEYWQHQRERHRKFWESQEKAGEKDD
jgi:hypothetical protein